MAEMLIVVAIIAVLGGVSFIAVWNYQRSLGQLERDNIAKEIFVAAQNHLTAVYGEGYLEVTDFGTPGNYAEDYDNPEKTETWKDIYYCIANGTPEETSMIGQMLPFGAIDETVRSGGSYLIRYQKKTGLVLAVFYCTRNGVNERFDHRLGSLENMAARMRPPSPKPRFRLRPLPYITKKLFM